MVKERGAGDRFFLSERRKSGTIFEMGGREKSNDMVAVPCKGFWVFCFILLLSLAFFPLAALLAQTPPLSGEIERSQHEKERREEIEKRITPIPNIFTPAELLSDQIERLSTDEHFRFPEETPCFVIQEIKWEGDVSPLKSDLFMWIQQETISQCVGGVGLRMLQNSFSEILMKGGYVTSRVVIAPQNLTTGRLLLQVIPGTIGHVRDEGEKIGTHKTLFPSRKNRLLNQRDLDHGLENIRRLKSQQGTTFDLMPGGQLGETDIVIKHPKSKRFNGLITLDDSGGKSTGKYQLGGTITFDSPFYLYDAISLSINRDTAFAKAFGSRSASLNYSIPWGYWLFSGSLYQSDYKQTIAGFSNNNVQRGESQGAELKGVYTLYRTARAKGVIPFKLSHQKRRSYIDDVQIEVQYNHVSDYETGFKQSQLLEDGTIEISLLQKGSLSGESDAPGFIIGVPEWDGRYRAYTTDINYALSFHLKRFPIRYEGGWRIQYADTPIPSRQFFAIGSRYTVRGFDGTQSLSAEKGWFGRNTLAVPIGNTGQEVYWGIDAGGVSGFSAALLPGRTLFGTVLGFHGGWRALQYDVTIGWPLDKPDSFETEEPAFTMFLSFAF